MYIYRSFPLKVSYSTNTHDFSAHHNCWHCHMLSRHYLPLPFLNTTTSLTICPPLVFNSERSSRALPWLDLNDPTHSSEYIHIGDRLLYISLYIVVIETFRPSRQYGFAIRKRPKGDIACFNQRYFPVRLLDWSVISDMNSDTLAGNECIEEGGWTAFGVNLPCSGSVGCGTCIGIIISHFR